MAGGGGPESGPQLTFPTDETEGCSSRRRRRREFQYSKVAVRKLLVQKLNLNNHKTKNDDSILKLFLQTRRRAVRVEGGGGGGGSEVTAIYTVI